VELGPFLLRNNSITDSCGDDVELCHNFIGTYLKGSVSRPHIFKDIVDVIAHLVSPSAPPPPSPQPVIVASGAQSYTKSRINNNGEIVWAQQNGGVSQVWSNLRGQISVGPNDHDPDINDRGEIIWRFGDGGGPDGIMSNVRGLIYLSPGNGAPIDPYYDSHRINNNGEIIWSSNEEIWSNTGGQLTHSPMLTFNRETAINDSGEVVYASYRINSGPPETITMNILSTTRGFITNDSFFNFKNHPDLNNAGEVVWIQDGEIWSNLRGRITFSNGTAFSPSINNNGEIVWAQNDGNGYEIYSSTRGQITKNTTNDLYPHINDLGVITWLSDNGKSIMATK
jgi:hypothetical protein